MRILRKYPEQVVMTEEGLMKKCLQCEQYKPLDCFRPDKMAVFQRSHLCLACKPYKGVRRGH